MFFRECASEISCEYSFFIFDKRHSNLDKFWLFRVLCVLLDNQDIQEYPLGYQEEKSNKPTLIHMPFGQTSFPCPI